MEIKNKMEESKMSTVDWCFNMRDKSYADGDMKAGEAYQDLGNMWLARETNNSDRGITKSCSE